MEVVNVDSLIKSLGRPGKFQVLAFVLICCNHFIVMCNHMAMAFYAAKTKHHCKVDNIQLVPKVTRNNEEQWEGCHVYAGNNTTETVPCTNGWTYYMEEGEATIISEFDLVCDNAYKSDLATTIYFCGVTVSGLLFGFLADKYGRRPVVGFTLVSSGAVGVAIVIFRNYVAFVVLRFLLGFLIQGLQNSAFILAMELFSTNYRAPAGFIFGLFGGVGVLIFALIAYLIRDWKYIQLTIAVLPFVQIFSLCIVPESLRWHLLYNNFTQAEAIVEQTATFNKLPFPRKLFDEIKVNSVKQTTLPTKRGKAGIFDVFASPELRKITFTLSTIWFTIIAAYYGLALNISFLFGDKYLNFSISTVMDMCLTAVMLWAVPRYGRRRPLALTLICCGMANCVCSVTASRSTVASTTVNTLGTAMAILGKTMVASSLSIIFIFTSELYPTVVRNVSLGVNTLWARIGGMAAPQIFLLGVYTSSFVPYTILAILTLMSGFLTLLLPDTHNKALSDRLEHAEPILMSRDNDDVQEKETVAERTVQLYETAI